MREVNKGAHMFLPLMRKKVKREEAMPLMRKKVMR